MKHFSGEKSRRSAEATVDLRSSTLRYQVTNDGGGSQEVFELSSGQVAQSTA